MQAMCTPMHVVLGPSLLSPSHATGSLYIGSMSAITDHELLRNCRISHFVQVLDAPWLPPLPDTDGNGIKVTSFKISILDTTSADLKPHLEEACNSIDRALRSGRSVLVHCQQGISRSAAVVIAYLIRNHGMSYDAAYALVKRQRACIKPNAGFVGALREWESTWRRPVMGSRRFTT
ncbi:protein-tyrosine phosphatase-like protein [Rhodocollybia butyracea]|uniref:protein-tyrosine-phosphatase n=1 Tax=Rhodocollybia butyracea TaxID=206335 RepID=A0A9P5Q6R2_9AGAR|nr:protein-tyrosine phosphatase-like protein [Rhodocollybia butyracea]